MNNSSAIKRTARQRSKDQVSAALQFSQRDENKIRKLAKLRGTTASKSVMELVNSALNGNNDPKSLTISEIMQLPAAERHRLLEEQARGAAKFYKNDPDLDFQINDDILEYRWH